MIRNFGIRSTTPGTAITATIVANAAPRPRKRSRARAYPARLSRKTRTNVTQSVTITEFLIQVGKSWPLKRSWYAALVAGAGRRRSGFAVALGSVLNDVTIAITNGKRKTRARTSRKAYVSHVVARRRRTARASVCARGRASVAAEPLTPRLQPTRRARRPGSQGAAWAR